MKKLKINWTYICVLFTTLLTIFLVISYMEYFNKYIEIPKCPIYETFNIYCPGCGATRAVYNLYNGHILASVLYNPLILYIVAIVLLYLSTETFFIFIKKNNIFFNKNVSTYIVFGFIVLFIGWIVKLLYLL